MNEEDFLDKWLGDYHNTSVKKVMSDNPQWDDGKDHSQDFYSSHKVTQEQHDEWYEWAINKVAKKLRCSKKLAKVKFSFAYLNVSPSTK